MRFEEKGDFLTFGRCDKCYIYFLLQDNEVVYVGQTATGLSRPLSHSDKEYDSVKAMPCVFERLDEIEDFYISKYKPKYNKCRNYGVVYSLNKVKSLIRHYYKPNFNLWDLRKIFSELNIIPFCDEYTGGSCITVDQYREIEAFIKGGLTR